MATQTKPDRKTSNQQIRIKSRKGQINLPTTATGSDINAWIKSRGKASPTGAAPAGSLPKAKLPRGHQRMNDFLRISSGRPTKKENNNGQP